MLGRSAARPTHAHVPQRCRHPDRLLYATVALAGALTLGMGGERQPAGRLFGARVYLGEPLTPEEAQPPPK
jgi:hypothetical protein